MALGPAIPPGFGLVMGWLIDNGHMMSPAEALEALENAKNGPRRPRRSRSTRSRTLRLPAKRTRKASPYQKEFGRQLKKLKRAHPRTPVTKLMKRAHAATRRIRRGK